MKVELNAAPTLWDWYQVKRRAWATMGKTTDDAEIGYGWKHRILTARHSPIRRLWFEFDIECPYWVAMHLARHKHADIYIQSQRNDRQSNYDRNKAPQDETVKVILDVNAEELMVIANKRLCRKASPETRELVRMMCDEVLRACPEFDGLLVPMCEYAGGCHEMFPCTEEKR